MTRFLEIAPGLRLPAAESVTNTFGVLAKRGAGKTYLMLVLVEELLEAGQMVCVIDPVGVCWGLRASADGRGPGYPVLVFGGSHKDLPIEPAGGELIADYVVDERRPCVIDLSELRKGEATRFVTDFAERLYQRNRQALQLVMDEADAFAPQKPMKGQERCLGAIDDLVRRGRARGIGVSLITQRAAVLNKNVLTQCEVLVALRTVSPQDRASLDAWVEAHGTQEQRAQLLGSLASLPTGEAWWWSPAWNLFTRAKARPRRTFDSSATPDAGKASVEPKALAKVDLETLRGKLAELAERAKASDPKALQARVAQLERDLQKAKAAPSAPAPKPEVVEISVLKPEAAGRLEELLGQFDRVVEKVDGELQLLRAVVARAERVAPAKPFLEPDRYEADIKDILDRSARAKVGGRGPKPAEGVAGGGPGKMERRILAALRGAGVALTRVQLGVRCVARADTGHFGNCLSALRSGGKIEGDASAYTITESGRADAPAELRAVDDVVEEWKAKLSTLESELLDHLVKLHPQGATRERLGEITGKRADTGHFGNSLSTLRSNGIVESKKISGITALFASEDLFA